jgi:DeoR/GlpR family transcriptional regulator of sugar metabolism
LLKKTYGGAIIAAPDVSPSVRFRQTKRTKAKRIVGEQAANLIKDGDIIYLEAGSTVYEIIPYLSRKKDLTILVNSLYLMRRLHEMTNHKIIIIGGQYRPDRMDMVGPQAEASIAQLGGFKAFTGADDITIDAGISGADVVTVGLARQVLKRSAEVIFVGDHTKFDNPALYKIAEIEKLDYIVTNRKPSKAWHQAAKEKNIRLVYPR